MLTPLQARICRVVGSLPDTADAVLAGGGIARIDTLDEMIDVIDVSAATEVVLATDCYIQPQATLEESEELRAERVARDPLMIEHPAQTKGVQPGASRHDDRLYLRVRLIPRPA